MPGPTLRPHGSTPPSSAAGRWRTAAGKCPISPFEWNCYENVDEVYIETAEYDCLRDRAIELADKLEGEGVNVTLNQTKGTVHGYDAVFDSKITKESVKMRLSLLHRI